MEEKYIYYNIILKKRCEIDIYKSKFRPSWLVKTVSNYYEIIVLTFKGKYLFIISPKFWPFASQEYNKVPFSFSSPHKRHTAEL